MSEQIFYAVGPAGVAAAELAAERVASDDPPRPTSEERMQLHQLKTKSQDF